MIYLTGWRYVEIEEPQHVRGGLYRRKTVTKRITVCTMTATADDADDLRQLAIFSDRLSVPIAWHTDKTPHTFSLTVTIAP